MYVQMGDARLPSIRWLVVVSILMALLALPVSLVNAITYGVTFTHTDGGTAVTENDAADQVQVVLNSQPAGTVLVTITFDAAQLVVNNETDGSVDLAFTSEDWNAQQTVTVAAVNDVYVESTQTVYLGFSTDSDDPNYDGLTHANPGFPVTLNDDGDGYAVLISASAVPMFLLETGSGTSYTVALTGAPASNVVVTVGAPGTVTLSEGDVPVDLTFTPEHWTPQTVTVTPVNDRTVVMSAPSQITHSLATEDPNYLPIAASLPSITLIVLNDDIATVSFETLMGTAEEGTSPYTVNTVLNISGSGEGEAKLGLTMPASITVTAGEGTASTSDYEIATPTVNFAADSLHGTTQPIDISIVNDGIDEPIEALGVRLVPGIGGFVSLSFFTHVVLIGDNDIEMQALTANGSFEDAGSAGQPAGWNAVNATGDKRVCENAFLGSCAYMFKGGAGENAKLMQKIDLDGMTFTTGDRFDLGYQWDAPGANAKISFFVTVKFGDGTDNIKFGSARGQTVGGYVGAIETQDGLPSAVVKSITITIQHKSKKGKVYVDELGLFFTQSLTRAVRDNPLPPPAAPDGFRGSN